MIASERHLCGRERYEIPTYYKEDGTAARLTLSIDISTHLVTNAFKLSATQSMLGLQFIPMIVLSATSSI